jgi:hypothetical protein
LVILRLQAPRDNFIIYSSTISIYVTLLLCPLIAATTTTIGNNPTLLWQWEEITPQLFELAIKFDRVNKNKLTKYILNSFYDITLYYY